MYLKTFQASTMAEAMTQVKQSIGVDAVIYNARTIQRRRWLGLRRAEVVEITAGRHGGRPADRHVALSRSTAAGRSLLQTPAAQNAIALGISQEIAGLKQLVKEIITAGRRQQHPQVPPELFDYYTQLIQSQVAEEIAADIIWSLHKTIRPEHVANAEFVRDKIAEQIERLLPACGPVQRTKTTGPHVVALIGPTGVGKTTTVAKLAANLKLQEKRRVGLITIDTYRIAAVDQLKKYADIIDAPLDVVSTCEEMAAAVHHMEACDYILIDTAGRSPNDTLKLNELKTFMKAAQPDEVHLVLSSTASQACVELAIQRFGAVRADKIIFTKLDEAAHLGVVLNVVKKVNKGLSYITTGQDVPDDIEDACAQKLAKRIVGTMPASLVKVS